MKMNLYKNIGVAEFDEKISRKLRFDEKFRRIFAGIFPLDKY